MRLSLLAGCLLLAGQTFAQTPQYAWGRLDGTVNYTSGVQNMQQVVAGSKGNVLWGTIQNKKATGTGINFGDYRLSQIDSSGNTTVTTILAGKIALLQTAADTAGNWYLLGTYQDSIRFANGMQLLRSTTAGTESEYFFARLKAGTLQPDWLVPAGSNASCKTECFAMNAGGLYFPIDSTNGTTLNRLNLTTGARSTLWGQSKSGTTVNMQADAKGNLYLLGNDVNESSISFNGTVQNIPAGMQYTWYIARYKANGQLHWNHFAGDITTPVRTIRYDGNNALFVSGNLLDSTTLAGHFFTKPLSFTNGDYLTVRLDTNGTLQWAQQRPAGTSTGKYGFNNPQNAVVADSNLYLFCSTESNPAWTGGTPTTGSSRNNGTLVQVSTATGRVNSARALQNNYSIPQQIATDGYNLWVTGMARDSTALHFDSVTVPVPALKTVPFLAKVKLRNRTQPVGINTVVTAMEFFRVSPNPASQTLTITAQKGLQYRLVDAAGRTLLSGIFKGGTENIAVGNLPRGFYLLEGVSAGGKQVQRVVLE